MSLLWFTTSLIKAECEQGSELMIRPFWHLNVSFPELKIPGALIRKLFQLPSANEQHSVSVTTEMGLSRGLVLNAQFHAAWSGVSCPAKPLGRAHRGASLMKLVRQHSEKSR